MSNIKKLILFKGDIETLGYFSEQLAKAFTELGYEVFVFDFTNEYKSFLDLTWFADANTTAMVTFNFTGINGDEVFDTQSGITFWEERNILCVNIIVDHPFYYHEHLKNIPPRYKQFCIDEYHLAYMKRFFPDIDVVSFLPLGGTKVCDTFIPYEERAMDIVMTGNYTPPHEFDQYINRIDEEYAAFYRGIIDELIEHPSTTMEEAMEKHAKTEMGQLSDEDLKACMSNMIFIDLYVRFYYRGLVVKTLVDHGFKVHVFGKGWDKLDCVHKENLIEGGSVDSHECLVQIRNARISLNVMPWFKAGAHDRIFNSILNKAVCVTDDSTYLLEQFTNHNDLVFYSLEHVDQLPILIEDLLQHPSKAKVLIENGYKKAMDYHTWSHRAKTISDMIL